MRVQMAASSLRSFDEAVLAVIFSSIERRDAASAAESVSIWETLSQMITPESAVAVARMITMTTLLARLPLGALFTGADAGG
jgi:hypothetical protein